MTALCIHGVFRQLIDHLSITVTKLAEVAVFYKSVMSCLHADVVYEEVDAIGFGERNIEGDASHTYISILESEFAIPDIRRHICFKAESIEQVKNFYHSGIKAGGSCEGKPGYRDYHSCYYATFLKDPEGNKVEAVYHGQHA